MFQSQIGSAFVNPGSAATINMRRTSWDIDKCIRRLHEGDFEQYLELVSGVIDWYLFQLEAVTRGAGHPLETPSLQGNSRIDCKATLLFVPR